MVISLAEEQNGAGEVQIYLNEESKDKGKEEGGKEVNKVKINTDSSLGEHGILIFTLFKWISKTRVVNTGLSPSNDESLELWSDKKTQREFPQQV